MALIKTQDPYFRYAKITHDAVSSADSGVPTTGLIFFPVIDANVLKVRASLTAGSATIRIKEYCGKLSEKLATETWLNGESLTLNSTVGLARSAKFDTQGAIVAIYVEAVSGGNLTIEGVLGNKEVAGN